MIAQQVRRAMGHSKRKIIKVKFITHKLLLILFSQVINFSQIYLSFPI